MKKISSINDMQEPDALLRVEKRLEQWAETAEQVFKNNQAEMLPRADSDLAVLHTLREVLKIIDQEKFIMGDLWRG